MARLRNFLTEQKNAPMKTKEKNRIAPTNGQREQEEVVSISAPNFGIALFKLVGVSPYVSAKFPEKARRMMQEKHEGGSASRSKKKREARDFKADYLASIHRTVEGKEGVPASAFRNAMISACRLVGFKMTLAKLTIFVEAEGFSDLDGTPLVHIHGKHEQNVSPARNATGVCDLRSRAMWRQWHTNLKVRWDKDQFTLQDVTNLLSRAGQQVGVGEGRPDSRMSCGLGWGMFRVEGAEE